MTARHARVCLFLMLLPVSAHAALLEMKIFGDSLSDTGNMFFLSNQLIPPGPLYFDGRFSNGPNWVDQVTMQTGAGTVNNVFQSGSLTSGVDNLAVGGAYTGIFPFPPGSANSNDLRLAPPVATFPGLHQQVQTYTALTGGGVLLNPDAWHVLWAGANDILFAPIAIDTDPATMAAVAVQAVANIGTAIEDLYSIGAREFMIFNIPDIGATPFGDLTGLAPLLSFGSGLFNTELDALIASLPGLYPEIDVMFLDVNALFSNLLFDVVTDPAVMAMFPDASVLPFVKPGLSFCLDQDGLTSPAGPFFCFGSDPDNRIFYDLVHPSSKAHGLIAAAVIDVKVAEPSTIALVLFGMIWLVCWAGRSGTQPAGRLTRSADSGPEGGR